MLLWDKLINAGFNNNATLSISCVEFQRVHTSIFGDTNLVLVMLHALFSMFVLCSDLFNFKKRALIFLMGLLKVSSFSVALLSSSSESVSLSSSRSFNFNLLSIS